VADRDLADCQVSGLSADARLNIAYHAVLQAAHVALAAAGYRVPKGESSHYRALQSLAYTVGLGKELVGRLDDFRKKRNLGSYETVGTISDQEAGEMLQTAKALRKQVETWLRKEHPGLLKG
jgi:hypothetical protein